MRSMLLLAAALTLTACGSDDVVNPPAPNPVTLAGSYQITTVGGQNLPYVVFEYQAYQASLVSGTLTLNENSRYTFDFNVRIDDSGNIRTSTTSEAGVWTVSHDSITLTSAAGVKTGAVSGNVITLQSGPGALVLRK